MAASKGSINSWFKLQTGSHVCSASWQNCHQRSSLNRAASWKNIQACRKMYNTSWFAPACTFGQKLYLQVILLVFGGHDTILQTVVGMLSIGLKLSSAHLLPTMPVMHTMPCLLAHCNESSSVDVPTSSSTWKRNHQTMMLACMKAHTKNMQTQHVQSQSMFQCQERTCTIRAERLR